MNVNQIVNMALRLLMRKALSSGINAGLNQAAKLGNKRKRRQQVQAPEERQDQDRMQG